MYATLLRFLVFLFALFLKTMETIFLCVAPSHKIPIQYSEICTCDLSKTGKVQEICVAMQTSFKPQVFKYEQIDVFC